MGLLLGHFDEKFTYFEFNYLNHNLFLLLLDTDIVHMDVSYLHELPLYVMQDLLFMFIDAENVPRIIYSFMNSSSVLCKISIWHCLMLPLPTKILYYFMNSSSVLFKISFWCYLLLRLLTKYTFFLHELLIWADQGFHLWLLDTKVVHIHIS